jgi:hypothetical protein
MTKYVTWTRFKPKFYGLKKIWSKNLKKIGQICMETRYRPLLELFTSSALVGIMEISVVKYDITHT